MFSKNTPQYLPELDNRNEIINRSWNRSYNAKVNQNDGYCHNVLDNYEFKQVKEKDYELIMVARPLLNNMFEFIKNTGCLLVLTNESGRIIDNKYDDDINDRLKQINFICGASWRENDVGTNAIGTTLAIKKPICVTGNEHYCHKHQSWTCSAAPIFDSNGLLVGIVDISGATNGFHPHTLGMVVMLADMISMQYRINNINGDMVCLNNKMSKMFNRISDGIIELDKNDRIRYINPVVKKILGRSEQEIIGKPITNVLGKASCFLEDITNMRYAEEIFQKNNDNQGKYMLCGEHILDQKGQKNGSMIILKKIDEQKNYFINKSKKKQLLELEFDKIIGESEKIVETKRKAFMLANCTANIVLQGESGTGKEMFAQAIHKASQCNKGPFIAVNCGAIPGELLISELFGYEEGSFTGALKGGKSGKFEQANGGTLFLDEISEMPLKHQVALLRVLQERRVIRIGTSKSIPLDVRVISATNKDLWEEVVKGNFRKDLYFRLNVVSINIPPLRSREGDIDILFRFFLSKYEEQLDKKHYIEPSVIKYLKHYSWPGNVRELQNAVERLVCLSQNDMISVSDLPSEILSLYDENHQNERISLSGIRDSCNNRAIRKLIASENERKRIIAILDDNGGNISRTAKEIGISRSTLYRKMQEYNINN